MCSEVCDDPRDAVMDAARAIRGLAVILGDRPAFVAGDAELPTLVGLIADRLEPAAKQLQSYIPRP